jgi:hypothetical protein
MNPENVPDMTLSELRENDEFDVGDEIVEDVADDIADAKEAMVILAATMALADMFEDDYITFREYIRLTDYLVEKEEALDNSPLR